MDGAGPTSCCAIDALPSYLMFGVSDGLAVYCVPGGGLIPAWWNVTGRPMELVMAYGIGLYTMGFILGDTVT